MAEAVITVLENRERDQQGAHPSGDSRLRTTIDRLSTMVGGTPSNSDSFEAALEASGAFKRMRTEMGSLSKTVDAQGRRLGELEKTSETTADDCRAIRALLEGRAAHEPSSPWTPAGP